MKKVVVAEASPTIKSVADSLLRQNGYDVVCTSDGLQAWEIISAEKPDLVLVGQGLSGMSGLDLCRQISSDRLTGGIPVVLMIGGKDTIDKEQILASGARGTLRKPFSPKDLLDVAGRLAGVEPQGTPEQVHSEISATQTKYNTQVSSTQHMHQKQETYNLEWLDLNETDAHKQISKIASFDISSEDQGLVIDNDQYGLAHPQIEQEEEKVPELDPEKDEDYEWFLGEIKKEMGSKNKLEHRIEPQISASPIPASNPMPGSIKFDDITTHEHESVADNARPREATAPLGLNASTNLKTPFLTKNESETSLTVGNLSDDELSLLADRIALRLAAHLSAILDKNQIIEAIKAALK
jgi:CheY-like chemotaxis protein